jgi:hypothetical protein
VVQTVGAEPGQLMQTSEEKAFRESHFVKPMCKQLKLLAHGLREMSFSWADQRKTEERETEQCQIIQKDQAEKDQAEKGKNQRPISWSLHKYFTSSKQRDSESLVALQERELETAWSQREKPWKEPLEAESKAFGVALEKAQTSEGQFVQQAPLVQKRKQKGGRPRQSRRGVKNVILTGQQRVFAVQYVETYLKQPGNSKRKAVDAVSKQLKCSRDQILRTMKKKRVLEGLGREGRSKSQQPCRHRQKKRAKSCHEGGQPRPASPRQARLLGEHRPPKRVCASSPGVGRARAEPRPHFV